MLDDAFLAAIIEKPDDDSVRLVYADWLEERGDPRGEFIRVQCTLARLPESDPRRVSLESRECELLKEHEEEWVRSLRDLVYGWKFRRGFVEEVVFLSQPSSAKLTAVQRLAPVHVVVVRSKEQTTW